MNKKARIKRFDKSVFLPEYKTPGAAGFDLSVRERMTIRAREVGSVPLNVAIHPPEGYFTLLLPRSSLHKHGLISIGGGVIDMDYSGNDDEYHAVLYNFTDAPVTIEKGDRLMQGIFLPMMQADFEEVTEMKNKNRGGFGSTGLK
ncbi:MAG TPA: dUTP diphosphatase [Candidatus Paceibacterota bacterium]